MEGWWQDGRWSTFLFALGVAIGTTLALGLYAWLGHLALRRSENVAQWANRFIGLVFWALGLRILLSVFVKS